MQITELHMMYKAETGLDHIEWEFEIYRKKGEWILEISDETKMEQFGRQGTFEVPDYDYIEYLENKVIELINSKK